MADDIEPPPEIMKLFFENAVTSMALVKACHIQDSHEINKILYEVSCCSMHMGFTLLGVMAFANHIIESMTDSEEEYDEFLQHQALNMAELREEYNARS